MACLIPDLQATIEHKRRARKRLKRLLGLGQDDPFPTDALFASLDLEVALDRKFLPLDGQPIITQIGFAYLDTRDLPNEASDIIKIRYFRMASLKHLISERAHRGSQRSCVFTEKQCISAQQVRKTTKRNLRVHNKDGSVRSIIPIGHSIVEDLKVLHTIDMNPFDFNRY